MNNYKWTPLAIALAMSASLSHATSNPSGDVDIDNDGLIEIATLQELDLMRYDLAGTSLNGDNTGCPATGCNGYELVNDLDFDTNGNGVADAGDLFWNNGEGWESIATQSVSYAFKAELNGNGHLISHLFSSRGGSGGGLFGYVSDTEIYDLKFEGANIIGGKAAILANKLSNSTVHNLYAQGSVNSYQSGGGLVVNSQNSIILDVTVNATVEDLNDWGNSQYLGGIVAYSTDTILERISFQGKLIGNVVWSAGGIVGMSYRETTVRDVSVTDAEISANFSAGGIFGDSYETVTVERAFFSGTLDAQYNTDPIIGDSYTWGDEFFVSSSYWDVEVSGISNSNFGVGKTTSELQCPTAPGDVSCDPTLFADWDAAVWYFGTNQEYPTLAKDSDYDGVLDFEDVDIDNDGLIEISTLQELDLMRYDLAGTSLNGNSAGCPVAGCNGYELVSDLDFDTNGNGVADAGDLFWNNGEGWESIATQSVSYAFKAELNGNGHLISHLFSSRGGSGGGLFGYVSDTEIYDLKFEGANIIGGKAAILANKLSNSTVHNLYAQGSVNSYQSGGGLVVNSQNSIILDVTVNATVEDLNDWGNSQYLGGIVAYSTDTILERISFQGKLIGNVVWSAGGIVGMSYRETTVRDVSVTDAEISANFSAGGIFGDSYETVTVERAFFSGTLDAQYNTDPIIGDSYTWGDEFFVSSSYWDVEVSGISNSNFGVGKTTSELQCPTAPGDVSCDPTLFADWDSTVWDFGTSSDYPVLR